MKLFSLIALVVIATFAPVWAEALKIGAAIPVGDAKMKNVDGSLVSIDSVKGPKGTLVIFSCNHCPFVHAWESRIVELGNSYSKQGVGVILINSNDPAEVPADGFAEMQQRAKEHNYGFPYVVDAGSVAARAFGAAHTPEIFLFDQSGKLVYHGAVDDNKNAADATKPYLKDALAAVVAGQPVAVQETRAIGCSLSLYKQ